MKNIEINTHSSIRIEGEKTLYFDPFRIEEKPLDADIIFITHDHYDHWDLSSVLNICKEGTRIIAPKSSESAILEKRIRGVTYIFLNPNEALNVDDIKIRTIPAYNLSKPFHSKANSWLGYIVTMDGVSYYVAGDTDCTEELLKVKADVAFLPVGGKYTMDYKEAATAISQMDVKRAIPTHYGSIVGSLDEGKKFREELKKLRPSIQVELKI